MNTFRSAVRHAVRGLCGAMPVRGRHRLADAMGAWLAPDCERLDIGGFNVEIDHAVRTCRHMYYGLYEEHLVNWIHRTIRPGDAIVEPGANIGYVTAHILMQLRGSGMLVALEPSRRCIEQLSSNNDLAAIGNLRLLNAAISGRSGTEIFWETPQIVSAGYGYLQPANWNNSTEGEAYEIPTHSVDDLMEQHGMSRLAFLKLDIEGSEWPALQGARQALARGAIDHIMVETYIDTDDAHSAGLVNDVFTLLESNGYRAHSMHRTGTLVPVDLRALQIHKWRGDVMWARA